jgi:hypothetical protein
VTLSVIMTLPISACSSSVTQGPRPAPTGGGLGCSVRDSRSEVLGKGLTILRSMEKGPIDNAIASGDSRPSGRGVSPNRESTLLSPRRD